MGQEPSPGASDWGNNDKAIGTKMGKKEAKAESQEQEKEEGGANVSACGYCRGLRVGGWVGEARQGERCLGR